jgi:hypothetical protein
MVLLKKMGGITEVMEQIAVLYMYNGDNPAVNKPLM